MNSWPPRNRVLTTDDLCPSNLQFWKYWLEIKREFPGVQVIVFVIANYRFQEDVSKSQEFRDWFERNRDWISIGIHGYDHCLPQEGWREDQEIWIARALDILWPFLPSRYLYRPPGFRFLPKTEKILRELGFAGIAHQNRIKYFDGHFEIPFNTHCCDQFCRPITQWRKWIRHEDLHSHS